MKVSLLSRFLTAVTLLLLVVLSSGELFAASGKIAGQVVDAESGDPFRRKYSYCRVLRWGQRPMQTVCISLTMCRPVHILLERTSSVTVPL